MESNRGNIQEINVSEIFKVFRNDKKTIIYFIAVSLLFSLITIFLSETLYTSTIKFIPQTENESNLGGLGGMASLAGISLGGNQNATSTIPSSMYPTIVKGIPFKLQVLDRKIFMEGIQDSLSVREYFNIYYEKPTGYFFKKYTIGIVPTLKNSFKKTEEVQHESSIVKNGVVYSSSSDNYIFGRLNDFISIDPGAKQGFASLSVSMPSPTLASQLNQICMEVLQKLLIEYKIATAEKEYSFLENQYQVKKGEYEAAQLKLAQFKDRNQGLISASSQTKQQSLQYEFDLSFSLFSEIAANLEQARIKISKDTPIFSVIDPVVIPRSKSHPNIPFYIVGFTFLGGFIGLIYVYAKAFKRGLI